jgi:hypothetical protein
VTSWCCSAARPLVIWFCCKAAALLRNPCFQEGYNIETPAIAYETTPEYKQPMVSC